MRISRTIRGLFAFAVVGIAATAWSQQADQADPKDSSQQPAQPAPPAPPQPPTPPGVQISGGGGVFRIAMPAGAMPGMPGVFAGDQLMPLITTLGELNLAPDFNLSGDQKTKIQSIRDDFKNAMEAWRKDHADDLKQLDEAQKELEENLRNGNPPDPQQMMEQMEQRRVLMETAPNGEEQANQVKGTLTEDQRKRLDAKLAEQEKQRQEMMQRMPFRFGPGMRAGQAGDKDKDEKKDEKDKGK